jgi:hypothetical protein
LEDFVLSPELLRLPSEKRPGGLQVQTIGKAADWSRHRKRCKR